MAEQTTEQRRSEQSKEQRRSDQGQWMQRSEQSGAMAPFAGPLSLMDWMLRDFFGAQLLPARSQNLQRLARLEVEDTGNELVVTAELPGVDPNNVQIECRDDVLTLRGESETEEGDSESYVSFYRQIHLPADVDVERAAASFKNGLLRIRFPKRGSGEGNVKRIPISSESQPPPAASEARESKERAA